MRSGLLPVQKTARSADDTGKADPNMLGLCKKSPSYVLAVGFGFAVGGTRAWFDLWHRLAHKVLHPLIFGCDKTEEPRGI